jgi:uracil-DNA glycosylase
LTIATGVLLGTVGKGKKGKVDPLVQPALFTGEMLNGPKGTAELQRLREECKGCSKCALSEHRSLVVFGSGPVEPLLAFVGEGPGETEDRSGFPFIGRAGQQLTRMIAAMGLRREEVFLCNAVMCRPEQNRTPTNSEVASCRPYLYGQLQAVSPKVIVCLGATAARAVLQEARAMEYMRNVWHAWEGIPVRVTYHPSFLIRPEGEGYKPHAWLDLQAVLERLGLPIPTDEQAKKKVETSTGTGWEF